MTDTSLDPNVIDWQSESLVSYARTGLLYNITLNDIREGLSTIPTGQAYLATPYTKNVTDAGGYWNINSSLSASFEAGMWSARLCGLGVTAVSPVVLSVEISLTANADLSIDAPDPLDAAAWQKWCDPILHASRALIIPPIAGWNESNGVWYEAVMMLQKMRPVYILEA